MRKHRFLFVMVEGGGNVPPQINLARELVVRGHRVRVLADPAVEAEARGAGCEFEAFRRAPHHNMRSRTGDILRDWEVPGPVKQLTRVGERLLFGPAEAYARDVLEEVARFGADVLVVDWMVPGIVTGAEASGRPVVLLIHHPYPLPGAGLPPFGLGFRPAKGVAGRLRDRLLSALMVRKFDSLGLSAINEARSALGLAPVASVFDQYARVERTLVLTSRAFDFEADALPARVRYVGPILDDPAWVEPWTSPWPPDHPDPLVLVSLGSTFQDQGRLTARVSEALSSIPVRGLVTLGDVFAPGEIPAADNVAVVRSAPHGAVLPLASAVVTHAGHGTVIKALAHGTPLVCIPLGRDQKDNAVRVEVAGAGLRISASADVRAIRRAVLRVLQEPRFAQAARRVATVIREERAEGAAVRELESMV